MSLQSTTIPCPAPPLVLPRHQSSHQTPSRAATHPFDMFDAMSDPYDTPKPMPEAIRVLPAMPADAPAMVEVMDSAFVPTFHYQRMYPSGIVPEEDKRKRIELMQEAIESNEHMKLFKAVSGDYDNADFSDDEGAAAAMSEIDKEKRNESVNGNDKDIMNTKSELGRIVGWAQWKMYYKERPVEEWNKVIEKRKDENIKGMNVEHANWFFGTMEENRKRLFGGMPFATLSIIVVQPAYQGKGIGSNLLQWGIQEAEKANLPLFLESSKEGYQLYAKNGFQKLSDLGIDPGEFDIVNINDITLMIRPPGGGYSTGNAMESLQRKRDPLPSPPPSI